MKARGYFVKDYAGDWIFFQNEDEAKDYAEQTDAAILYGFLPSDVIQSASDGAEAGISGDGTEAGGSSPGLPQSWRSHDLTPGHAYDSIHFGVVCYEGVDAFYGQNTHKFKGNIQGLVRYVQAHKLDEFLKPKGAAE